MPDTTGLFVNFPGSAKPTDVNVIPIVRVARAPTVKDKLFRHGQFWLVGENPTTGSEGDLWYLKSFVEGGATAGEANWVQLGTGGGSGLQTNTSDSGTATIDGANNINILGNAGQGVSTSASSATLTVTVADATDSTKGVASFNSSDFTVTSGAVSLASTVIDNNLTFQSDSGNATSSSGTIILAGGGSVATSGTGNTVTITGSGAQTFNTDSGTATTSGNAITIQGTANEIEVSGSGSTVTVGLVDPVIVAKGGTGTNTLHNNGVLIGKGTSAVVATAALADGQLLIGNTGSQPAAGTLTAGEGIDVTNASGSITLSGKDATAGASAGAANKGIASFDSADFTVSSGFVSLASGAVGIGELVGDNLQTASGNSVTVAGGTGITTAGDNVSTLTVNLDVPVVATNGGTGQTTYTTGDILYASATNTLSKLAIGSTGEVLKVSGGVPAWGTESSAVFEFVSSSTPSAASSVDITGLSSTYQYYIIAYYLETSVDDIELWVRTSTNNGSSFDSGASDYTYGGSVNGSTSIGPDISRIRIQSEIGNGTNEFCAGYVRILDPSASNYHMIDARGGCTSAASGSWRNTEVTGCRRDTTAVNAIQLLPESGTVTGEVHVYGVRPS